MALMMFKSEYGLVKAILDMNEKGNVCIGRITESIIPYIALISHGSTKWLQKKSGEYIVKDNPRLNRKRMLFKYYDDTSYTAKEYDLHCANVLKASSDFFKKPAGLLSFIQQDAGIFILNGLAIGSTYTSFRYLYDEFVGTDYMNDLDFVNGQAGEVGHIIGQHSAFLVALMEAFGLKNEPLEYEPPRPSENDYDFFLGNLTRPLYQLNENKPVPGLFIILSDAYFSFGLFQVLLKCNIVDNILGLKLVLLTLHHLKSSVNSVVALSHKQLSQPFSNSLHTKLSQLFKREERELLKRCKPLRNTLVHYCFPADIEIEFSNLGTMAESITDALTFSTNMKWDELTAEILNLGERVHKRLEKLLSYGDFLSER